MNDKKLHAHVEENGNGAYGVNITVSGHELRGDEPEEAGGNNSGPAPYDYLLTSLGCCTAITVRWYAKQQNWPLEKVSVDLTHHKEGRTDIFEKAVTLKGDALSQEQRDKLYDVAAKCPVQRTLEGTPVIKTIKT